MLVHSHGVDVCHLLRKKIIIVFLDIDLGISQDLPLGFVLLLEIALGVHVSPRRQSLHLRDEPWCFRAGLEVQERVGGRRFGREPGRCDQLHVRVGPESEPDFLNFLVEFVCFGAIFVHLFFVRHEVGQMDFPLIDVDLLAHLGAHHCGEVSEVKVPFVVLIQMIQQGSHLLSATLNLHCLHLLLEISIRDKPIPVLIELLEQMVHLNRPVKDPVLNLSNELLHPVIVNVLRFYVV